MAFALNIGGVDKATVVNKRSFQLDRQLGYRATLQFTCLDNKDDGTAYRPTIGQDVSVVLNGTTIFAGRIRSVRDQPRGEPHYGTAVHVVAADYNEYPGRRRVFKEYAAGQTLKAVLEDLHSSYIAVYSGHTASIPANGPTLNALAYDGRVLKDVLDELVMLADWVWYIDFSKVFRAQTPTGTAAPFNLDENTATTRRIHWAKDLERYRNRIYVRLGSSGVVEKTQDFDGDGANRIFPLKYTPISKPGYVSVNRSGGGWTDQPLGWWVDQDANWLYDPDNYDPPAVRQKASDTVLGVNDDLHCWFQVQFPITVTGEVAAAATDPDEDIYEIADLYDVDAGQAVADALVADRSAQPKEVEIDTRYDGLAPGQTITLAFPKRNIASASYLITGLTARMDGRRATTGSNFLLYTATCAEGATVTRNWRDYWRGLGGGGSATQSVTLSLVAGGGGASTSSPYKIPFELGGSGKFSVVPSGTAFVDVIDWRDIPLDGTVLADVPCRVRVWGRVTTGGETVTPRLYDQTTGAAVATGTAISATTDTEQTFLVTLNAGLKNYRLQAQPGGGAQEVYLRGRLELY